jgi:hypothetical protein
MFPVEEGSFWCVYLFDTLTRTDDTQLHTVSFSRCSYLYSLFFLLLPLFHLLFQFLIEHGLLDFLSHCFVGCHNYTILYALYCLSDLAVQNPAPFAASFVSHNFTHMIIQTIICSPDSSRPVIKAGFDCITNLILRHNPQILQHMLHMNIASPLYLWVAEHPDWPEAKLVLTSCYGLFLEGEQLFKKELLNVSQTDRGVPWNHMILLRNLFVMGLIQDGLLHHFLDYVSTGPLHEEEYAKYFLRRLSVLPPEYIVPHTTASVDASDGSGSDQIDIHLPSAPP